MKKHFVICRVMTSNSTQQLDFLYNILILQFVIIYRLTSHNRSLVFQNRLAMT